MRRGRTVPILTPASEPGPVDVSIAFADGPRLLADIGATNARFALETEPGRFSAIEVLRCDDYAGVPDVLRAYLHRIGIDRVAHAGIAIANPIGGDLVRMTNRDWSFSIEETRAALDLSTLLVVNDFTALAMSLRHLGQDARQQIGRGSAQPRSVIGLLGPGTGLGVSALIPTQERWVTLGSEGGHVSFAPNDERELDVLRFCWREYPHVSAERLISGPGLELTYRALASRAQTPALPRSARDIVEAALAGTDPVCVETVDCFCGMLGTVAANLAVTLGALGGIYIGGGIVPRLGARFEHSPFRARFEAKGRFSDYLAAVPTYVITAPYPAFHGVSAILADTLRGRSHESPLIEKIRGGRLRLSKAEQKVADLVLARPRAVLSEPIVEIARHADVSQPTVIRFCRSLGFQGLSDFKLKLASGLTGTIPVRHSQVRDGDTAPDVSAKVLENTASALLRLRDAINVSAVEAATVLLRNAARVEFYAVGNAAVVALDAQLKFFRFRIPSVAYSDTHLQAQSAQLLRRGDVVVVISTTGRPADLLRVVDLALEAGADVIAITPSKSPLARKATVCIGLDQAEQGQGFISMISRVLQLAIIDVLAVGVAIDRVSPAAAGLPPGDDESIPEPLHARSRISHVSG